MKSRRRSRSNDIAPFLWHHQNIKPGGIGQRHENYFAAVSYTAGFGPNTLVLPLSSTTDTWAVQSGTQICGTLSQRAFAQVAAKAGRQRSRS
jgi:hypothetical protein